MQALPIAKIPTDHVAGPIYERLLVALADLGPHELEEKKTSIHVVRGRAFLGIHPRKNALLINIVTAQPIVCGRAVRHDQVPANRVHNKVLLHDVAEVDATLSDWLREAYSLVEK
jgi:hypothetical protein